MRLPLIVLPGWFTYLFLRRLAVRTGRGLIESRQLWQWQVDLFGMPEGWRWF